MSVEDSATTGLANVQPAISQPRYRENIRAIRLLYSHRRTRWLTNLCLVAQAGAVPDPGAVDVAVAVPIFEIQRADHHSPFAGEMVTTSGIVTVVDDDGFFLQDPGGDGDDLTSDAIYVYTSATPVVRAGDQVEVVGKVIEFIPGGERSANLSLTEITLPERVDVLSSSNSLPRPVLIGQSGRLAPTEIVDDDHFAVFDPHMDGIDFYESLEGMRVTIEDASAVSATNRFGEIFTVSNRGQLATGMNARGGITMSERDSNPERLQIDGRLLVELMPMVKTGDLLGDVTGVMGYSYGNFEVLAETIPQVTSAEWSPEVTFLTGDEHHLTIATYNVQNLDPGDPPEKFQRLAGHITWNLQSPDIIALQEVQDNSGPTDDGETAADGTASLLTHAVLQAGGPAYDYYDLAPVDGRGGGEPGGNIRAAYLVNPGRVTMVLGSLRLLEDTEPETFNRSLNPLEATFLFNDEEIILINCHLSSKAGSAPQFGSIQPPRVSGEHKRKSQAVFLRNHVAVLLDRGSPACVILLGDLNDTEFSDPLRILTGEPPLFLNLGTTLSVAERYSHSYQGNAQMIDHILVNAEDIPGTALDAVHVNTGFADKSSDHDPLIARIPVPLRIDQLSLNQTESVGDSAHLQLSQNSPNPVGETTHISYLLRRPGMVQLRIFNIAGQLVRTLVDTYQDRGRHQFAWNLVDQGGKAVSNGIYCYQLRMASTTLCRSMVVKR